MAVRGIHCCDAHLCPIPLMDIVVACCAVGRILDLYRRWRDDYGVCRVMPKGEYAPARRRLFGEGRAGEDAAGGQSFNVVGVCSLSSGIGTDSL
jgi:hypothetical protein